MKELYETETQAHGYLDDNEVGRTIRHSHQNSPENDAGREEKQKQRKRVYLHSIGRFKNLKKLQSR